MKKLRERIRQARCKWLGYHPTTIQGMPFKVDTDHGEFRRGLDSGRGEPDPVAYHRYLRPPIIPAGAKIITFPGIPGPANAMLDRWTEKSQIRTSCEHLKWVWQRFSSGKPWKNTLPGMCGKPLGSPITDRMAPHNLL